MVNSIKTNVQYIYLCGLSTSLEREYTPCIKESLKDCKIEAYSLEDGLKLAIHNNPSFLFLYIQDSESLREVFSDITFLRRYFPFINRVLVCNNEIYSEQILDQISFDGILIPTASRSELLSCLTSVNRGMRYVHPSFRQRLRSAADIPPSITVHERKILSLIANGLQNKQIAEQLFISPHTVKNHKSKLMVKLDLNSTIDLYKYALHHAQDTVLLRDTS